MKKLLLCALLACAGAIGPASNANAAIYNLVCTTTAGEVQARLNGSADWTTPPSKNIPVSGDMIQLVGTCLGDVYVATSGLLFTNRNDATTGCADTFNGMFEVAGANITINCLILECTTCSQTTTSTTAGTTLSTQTENGALVLHDGAVVLAENDVIQDSQTSGIWLARSSSVTLTNTNVLSNGSGGTGIPYTAGIFAKDSSSVRLGLDTGGANNAIESNGGSGCPGYGIAIEKGSSLESFDSIIGTQESTRNSCGALYVDSGSSANVENTVGSPIFNGTAPGPAITVLRASSLVIEPLFFGGRPKISSTGGPALLIVGASSASLNSVDINSPGSSAPTIEASGDSNLILAGGNNICAGTLSGSTCTGSGGTAIEIDHSSSLQHILATTLGYASPGAEAINGKGTVLMQSSADLGQGPVSGAFGLVWTGSTIAVGQNSAIRMESGVHVTGAVQISAASNGYFNCNNNGNSCSGAGAANEIDGTVQCLELLATPANPSVHVSNPQLIVNSSLAADSGVAVANLFGASSFATSAPAANTCLNF
jgi:hypothetical protein